MLVERQECQQPRDTAVAITEGMDAEEIEHEAGNGQQRGDMFLVKRVAVSKTQLLNRPWRLRCRDRTEAHKWRPSRAKLHNLVIDALPLASIASPLLNGAVQPLEEVRRDGKITSTRVNQVEGPPIPLDLFLRTIVGCGVAKHERPESCWFDDDPLNTIGRFHALYQGRLAQGLEH